jgi:Protein of unknown function (DUF3761)/Protein of unknown function (DUF1524)
VKFSLRLAIIIFSLFFLPSNSAYSETFKLTVAEDHAVGYSRALFKHWTDSDGNGCNTRAEVLIIESTIKAKKAPNCKITFGKWKSYYDNKEYTNPSLLDIDHLVPLNEAWRSGAWNWTNAERSIYANDLTEEATLVAVSYSLNRSKGDKDIANWIPPKNKCRYVSEWVRVKAKYKLTVDRREAKAISELNSQCKILNVEFLESGAQDPSSITNPVDEGNSPKPTVSPSLSSETWPENSSAKCRDGTYSYSKNRSGTCSGHGGVAQWRSP